MLSEGRKFFAAAHQRNVPQLDAFFLPPLLEALDLNWSDRAALFNEPATNSWLEDAASANGSEWADAKAAGIPLRTCRPPKSRNRPLPADTAIHACGRARRRPVRAPRTSATSISASGSSASAGTEGCPKLVQNDGACVPP